ncbi:MAG: hypothetical protein KF861_05825 [Planctomycetaceae bacterium]|nr:hypothetical protein [Planctomycetaceae bacterium]
MDPQATWTELLEALIEDDWPAAAEAAEALAEWLDRGGFAPRITTALPPEHPLHRAFARVLCEQVLRAPGDADAAG